MELTQAVDALLTSGSVDGHELPGLLDQLQDAVENSGGSGSGRGSPQKAPASLDVLGLLAQIDAALASALRAAGCTGRLDKPRDELLRHLVGHAGSAGATSAALADQVWRWVAAAHTILSPDRRIVETRAQPCPSCAVQTVLVWSADLGERVQRPALYLDTTDLTVYCRCCGASWGPSLWDFLRGLLENASNV